MNEDRPDRSILTDEPGMFHAEVHIASEEAAMSLGYTLGDEGVLLSVRKGVEDIHLDLAPSDIPRLRKALDYCEQRMAAEQEALRADADRQADQS